MAAMKRHVGVALGLARPVVLALLAVLLIEVLLPLALAADAGTAS